MKEEKLLKLFNYHLIYKSGRLYWKTWLAGRKAGSISSSGHRQVCIKGKIYLSSRITFLIHHGYLPKVVDHKDGNPLNDSIKNLRAATHSQNSFNSKKPTTNTSGVKGVHWHTQNNNWSARINCGGRRVYSKQFDDINIAEKEIKKKRKELHGDFANNG